jgi:hypothetical protein
MSRAFAALRSFFTGASAGALHFERARRRGTDQELAVLNYNHLYYFYVVASERSVKAAADRLGVTQPTISEQIRLLERALGVPLFDRTPSGLQLTRSGREASATPRRRGWRSASA